jgi:hypothetical protein
VKRGDVKKRLKLVEGEEGMMLSKEEKTYDNENMSKGEESECPKTRNR